MFVQVYFLGVFVWSETQDGRHLGFVRTLIVPSPFGGGGQVRDKYMGLPVQEADYVIRRTLIPVSNRF
jgi:hypothetical protein